MLWEETELTERGLLPFEEEAERSESAALLD